MNNHKKQPQTSLERSRDLLLQFVEHTPAPVAMFDRDMRYIMASRRYITDYHLKEKDIIGLSHYEVFPEIPERWKEAHRRCLAGATERAQEDPFPRADGRLDWVRWEIQPWYEANGEISGIILFSEVITAQKLAQDALKENEQKYRDLVENIQDLICTHDLKGKILSVNQAAITLLGYEKEELLKINFRDLFFPKWKDAFDEFIATVKSNGSASGLMTLRTAWGEKKVFEYQSTLQTEGVSEPIVRGIAHDITDQRRREKDLQDSEKKFRDIFNSITDVFYRTDTEGRIQIVSPSVKEIFGYAPEEIIGEKLAKFYINQEQRKDFLEFLNEKGEAKGYEALMRRKDGTAIWISTHAHFFKDDAGNILGVQGISRDITESKKKAEDLRKLEAQLQQAQKMESVGRLAGGVAHDFNNMLGVIIGHAELAMEQVVPVQPLYADLTEIRKAAQRSADLTRQLLAFARRQTAAPRILDLNDTISGMLNMLGRLIGEDIDLAWMPQASLWPVKIDPAQIDQILANLCVNARDAIGGVGKVTIETQNVTLDETYCSDQTEAVPGDYVMLSVSDDGCGMDKETLMNLFEPFFTTKDVGEGTGLGLATVYGIVKQNNGFISIYSEPGQGAMFKIYLPRTHNIKEEEKQSGVKTIDRGTETVLLVEDEESILRLGKTVLERFGYTVLDARAPREAMATAEHYEGSIHLLVTDVVMPEMNGKELKERIEKIKPNIKALFMSGYTANVIMHRGILESDVHFLQKPFTVNSLAGKVREVLDQKEISQ